MDNKLRKFFSGCQLVNEIPVSGIQQVSKATFASSIKPKIKYVLKNANVHHKLIDTYFEEVYLFLSAAATPFPC